MKQLIKKIIEHFGYEIRKKNIFETIYQTDPLFNNRYEEAQLNTQMVSTDNLLRRQRHYVLNYLIANVDLSTGDVCEAGRFFFPCIFQTLVYRIRSPLLQKVADKGKLFDNHRTARIFALVYHQKQNHL